MTAQIRPDIDVLGNLDLFPLVPTPTGDALGLETLERGAEVCVMRLPRTPQSSLAGTGRIDRGAILTLADQCMGTAAVGIPPSPCMTLDLRVDWLGRVLPGQSVQCVARRRSSGARCIYVEADFVHDRGGPLLGRCVGQFLSGTYPGGGAAVQHYEGPPLKGDWSGFIAFLGLEASGGRSDRWSVPAAEHRVGTVFLPAIHGGVMAAAMERAMASTASFSRGGEIEIYGSSFEFLRPGRGDAALDIQVDWIRKGRSVGVLSCLASQPGLPGPIARGRTTVRFAQ